MGYIYGLECPINKRIVYIGLTRNTLKKRLTSHISETKSKIVKNETLTKKDNWIKKLILLNEEKNIKIVILEECENLEEREIFWILKYIKEFDLKNTIIGGRVNGGGYNLSEETKKRISDNRRGKCIGEKNYNYNKIMTDYEKNKLSKKLKEYYKYHDSSLLNKKLSIETKKRISENRRGKCKGKDHPLFGTIRTDETKNKISNKIKGENHPNYGKHRSEETKKKISNANSGNKNGMFGKLINRTEEQKEKMRLNMINSEKFQKSRKSQEFRDKISNIQSIPILLLDQNYMIIMEFKNTTKCAEYFGYTRGNIKNAVRDLRMIGKGEKFWVVRKEKLSESIKTISIKNQKV